MNKNIDKEQEVLLQQFEQLREDMNKKAAILGVRHPEVIKLSQELDRIHMELLKNKESRREGRNNSYMPSHSNKIELVYERHDDSVAYLIA